jgi:hypothetical protein
MHLAVDFWKLVDEKIICLSCRWPPGGEILNLHEAWFWTVETFKWRSAGPQKIQVELQKLLYRKRGGGLQFLRVKKKKRFGNFPFWRTSFSFSSATREPILEEKSFRSTPQKQSFSVVKSVCAPVYAVCWQDLRAQNGARTAIKHWDNLWQLQGELHWTLQILLGDISW